MSKAAIASALLAITFLLLGVDAAAAGKTVSGCKVAEHYCDMRCRRKLRPVLSKRCLATCQTTRAKCIQQAQKDIELGKVAPPAGGGTTKPGPRQSEEDKKNAEMGKTAPPAGHPTSSPPLQPCASWQVRYSNGTCGCPSGMRGAKCDEIILH